MKPKLSVAGQIEHMKQEGIGFSIVNEEDAREFLENSTYYFKVKAYAKNYDKFEQGDKRGQYVNLEFAYLRELSTLDAHLRKFIIKTALDVEHFLKVQLLKHLENNENEDGYAIVAEYLSAFPAVLPDIEKRKNNSNCYDMIEKYHDCFALWNIVEVLTFRQFVDLYELYFSKYPSKASMKNCLKPIQFLRNAAAHNNCLINRLNGPYSRNISTNKRVENFVARITTIKATARNKKMQNPVIHDFVTMLYVYKNVVTSKRTMQHMAGEMQELIKRIYRHQDYFRSNSVVLSYFEFLKKIVDFFTQDAYYNTVEQTH